MSIRGAPDHRAAHNASERVAGCDLGATRTRAGGREIGWTPPHEVWCSPVNNSDPTFDRPSLEAKVGPFLADPALYLENNLPPPFPVLNLEGDMDEWCCGPSPLLPEAAAVGATNNCRWLHEDVARRMDGLGPTVQSILVPGYGHVIADDPGAHQALVEAWYQATLARAVAPSFPP